MVTKADVQAFMAERSEYTKANRFEDIEVKENAPELLEKALSSKRKPCMIGTGAMSTHTFRLKKI